MRRGISLHRPLSFPWALAGVQHLAAPGQRRTGDGLWQERIALQLGNAVPEADRGRALSPVALNLVAGGPLP